jgi:hypothetical protein
VSPFAGKNILVAFYKKYSQAVKPSPFDIPVVEIEKRGVPASYEDSIEVISILPDQADISIGNKTVAVMKGLQSTKFPAVAGPVKILLQKENKELDKLVCPEWITDKPYRTDRLTYSFSNQSTSFYRELFNGHDLMRSEEYNPTATNNKIQFYSGN